MALEIKKNQGKLDFLLPGIKCLRTGQLDDYAEAEPAELLIGGRFDCSLNSKSLSLDTALPAALWPGG
jgi:hypothetical protein